MMWAIFCAKIHGFPLRTVYKRFPPTQKQKRQVQSCQRAGLKAVMNFFDLIVENLEKSKTRLYERFVSAIYIQPLFCTNKRVVCK